MHLSSNTLLKHNNYHTILRKRSIRPSVRASILGKNRLRGENRKKYDGIGDGVVVGVVGWRCEGMEMAGRRKNMLFGVARGILLSLF